jgi:hypothetical protein
MEKAKKPEKAGKDTSGMVPVEKIKKEFPDASPQKIARLQTMLGDKTAPMKKERLFEGDKGRRKNFIKKLKDQAGKTLGKVSPLGVGFTAKDIVSNVSSKLNEPVKKASGGRIGLKHGSYKDKANPHIDQKVYVTKSGKEEASVVDKDSVIKNKKKQRMAREVPNFKQGGRAMYKSGSKGCKLAMKGKGRAYGKNS